MCRIPDRSSRALDDPCCTWRVPATSGLRRDAGQERRNLELPSCPPPSLCPLPRRTRMSEAGPTATSRPTASACTSSRPATARRSSCCTASPSSGTPGGTRSPPWPPPASASSPRPARLQPLRQAARRRAATASAISSTTWPPSSATPGAGPPSSATTGAASSPGAGRCAHPELVERLVDPQRPAPGRHAAASCAPPGSCCARWYVFFFQLPRLPERFLRRDDFAAIRRALRREPVHAGAFTPEECGVRRGVLRPGGADGGAELVPRRHALPEQAGRGEQPIRVPTLLIWGERDRS